ncbi:MAG: glycosyltransferase family 2 protein [Planctomycetota bacterium]|nr:glycosyltransferase family 2 protein [Planctomycetota bacterium]
MKSWRKPEVFITGTNLSVCQSNPVGESSLITALLFLITLAVFAAVQTLMVVRFKQHLGGHARETGEEKGPDVAVLLCVRGADPSLSDCISGLAGQSYRNWRLIIVADDPQDPACETIESSMTPTLRERTEFHITPADDRLTSCSLKCSNLLSAFKRLSLEEEVVAFLDADTCPTENWLDRLVAPLQDDRVGCVSGIRWYQPQDGCWGSWVRYVWNAAAIVQMWFYGIPWGGSLAIRRRIVEQANLLDVWRETFCEDTPLPDVLRRLGSRVEVAADLVVVNRESCDYRGLSGWVGRQLLTTRLHHWSWGLVLGHAISTTLVLAAGALIFATTLMSGAWKVLGVTMFGLVLYQWWMLVLVRLIDSVVATNVNRTSGKSSLQRPGAMRLWIAIGLSQITYARAAWFATFKKTVVWRGIEYQIGPRRSIRRVHYMPYTQVRLGETRQSID